MNLIRVCSYICLLAAGNISLALAGPYVFDGDGNNIGIHVENHSGGGGPVPIGGFASFQGSILISPKSFIFSIVTPGPDGAPRVSDIALGLVVYETNDCSGTPFLQKTSKWGGTPVVFSATDNRLYEPPNHFPLFYVPSGAQPVQIQVASMVSSEGCLQRSPSYINDAFRGLPNDVDITGVFNSMPMEPLIFRHPEDPSITPCLFADSFQQCR